MLRTTYQNLGSHGRPSTKNNLRCFVFLHSLKLDDRPCLHHLDRNPPGNPTSVGPRENTAESARQRQAILTIAPTL